MTYHIVPGYLSHGKFENVKPILKENTSILRIRMEIRAWSSNFLRGIWSATIVVKQMKGRGKGDRSDSQKAWCALQRDCFDYWICTERFIVQNLTLLSTTQITLHYWISRKIYSDLSFGYLTLWGTICILNMHHLILRFNLLGNLSLVYLLKHYKILKRSRRI